MTYGREAYGATDVFGDQKPGGNRHQYSAAVQGILCFCSLLVLIYS